MNLSVIKDDLELQKVDLGSEVLSEQGDVSFFIGRSSESHIVLDDRRISREHAEIIYSNGAWKIKSVGQSQVLVNNSGIGEHILNNGDIIEISPFKISVSNIVIPEPTVKEEIIEQQLEEVSSTNENIEDEPLITETIADSEDDLEPPDNLGDDLEQPLDEADIDDELSNDENEDEGFDLAAENDLGIDDENDDLEPLDGVDNVIEEENDFLDSENNQDFEVNESDGGDDFSEDFQDGEEAAEVDEYGDEFAPAEFEDGGFDDGGFDDGYGGEDGTQIIQSFAKTTLVIDGQYAPYDKYAIDKNEVKIGRDPDKCDIILADPEVSGIHAVIKKSNITCILEDSDSANGTLLNGERVNSATLTNGDEFVIGTTTFTVKISSDFLKNEQQRLMPVEENQVVEVEEVVEVGEDEEIDDDLLLEAGELGDAPASGNQSLFSKDALKDPEKRKKLLYGLIGLLGLWVFLDDGKKPVAPKKPKEEKNNRLLNKGNNDKTKTDPLAKTVDNKPLTAEQKEFADSTYRLAKELFDVGRYREVLDELAKIHVITPNYKNSKQLEELAQEGLKRLAELAEEKRQEEEKKKKKAKVEELVAKAKKAVKERNTSLSEALFGEIAKLDPENFDLTQLKLEIEAYKREEERKALEKAQKEAERKRQLELLTPGKNYFLKGDWYRAILKLEDYLRKENLDEDLRKEGADMLKQSRDNLSKIIDPMLGRARSLKEGQDLKGAYEIYIDIYKKDPSREEVLKEMYEIKETLDLKARKIYREAIIAESLSLFDAAKEKFQEVQQLSPVDSEYYKKATEKLKAYLE